MIATPEPSMKTPEERVESVRRRLTVRDAACAFVYRPATLRDRLVAALALHAIAIAPAGRFGLEAADTASVAAYLKAEISILRDLAAPAARCARTLARKGMARDEIFNDPIVTFHGFSYGDFDLLDSCA